MDWSDLVPACGAYDFATGYAIMMVVAFHMEGEVLAGAGRLRIARDCVRVLRNGSDQYAAVASSSYGRHQIQQITRVWKETGKAFDRQMADIVDLLDQASDARESDRYQMLYAVENALTRIIEAKDAEDTQRQIAGRAARLGEKA